MAKTDSTFLYVATYPDEAMARADYQVVKELHSGGLVGSYDAAVIVKDIQGKMHVNKDETATRWSRSLAPAVSSAPGGAEDLSSSALGEAAPPGET